MSLLVFTIVLFAAVLHAGWNALVKSGSDKVSSMTAVVLGQAILGAASLPFVPTPVPESWPWIASGAALHIGYQFFLIAAYRAGDFSQVYPLARGVAPLLVALVSVFILGTVLSGPEWLGVLLIASGLASLVIVKRGKSTKAPARGAAILALSTGVFIAAYSLNDGTGARISGTALGFYGWVAMLNGITFTMILAFWRPGALRSMPRMGRAVILGGGASYVAYALVVWAFTHAPIALVSALRETSIVFALLIAVGVMGEKLDLRRVIATFLTLAGAVLLRMGRSS